MPTTATLSTIMRNPDDMKGKMVRGKPLYVAPAQRKEDRRASLQARFSQVRPVAMGPGPSVGPRVPMYPPGAPGLGQQIFYGQPPPTLFPPQMVPKFRAHSYPPGGNVPDVQTPGAVGGMLNPNEMGGLPMQDVTMPQPIPIAALPSALANAPPEQQRLMLGDSLYHLLSNLNPLMQPKFQECCSRWTKPKSCICWNRQML
ncbi:Polyadenylate-binding protein [Musa troglodytarum]|uniref:Polyadenylate-binding protein n=1 Tax=Musa troglodytarum TaxID=320322 RepID=A0A9E7HYW9_9LILI|nr:Polyadenylate-binding protein [Musa troglodytarum]